MINPQPLIRLDIFGLTDIPFRKNTPALYLDENRQKTLQYFHAFLQHRGFAVLAAPPGCGKTIFLQKAIEQLNKNANHIIYSPFSIFNERDMLQALCQQLNIQAQYAKADMIQTIQTTAKKLQPNNIILIIDEIQKIAHQTLELIRLISNFQFDEKNYFSIIFAGTDEFLDLLRLRINDPLRQRITLFLKLKPFSNDHTKNYIQHHLKQVGAHREIFPDNAMALIHDISGGIPRIINTLALAAMHMAAIDENSTVTLDHVYQAKEISLLPQRQPVR